MHKVRNCASKKFCLTSVWIVTLFDFNVQNAYINSHLQDELIDICVDLEAQLLFKHKKLCDSAM